jgi:CubicO group peptidase (beta-lactamase class C family)
MCPGWPWALFAAQAKEILSVTDTSMAPAAPITTLVPDLDAVISNVMAEWHIPGLAVAVLRRDAPPLLQAVGLKDIDRGTPVDTSTLFPIGSITKCFTATALALLVDEGKLGWDVPVREILPGFRLKDPIASGSCTLRDLLTHRSGLPRHDWVHTSGHLDNAGMLAALRHLDPSKEFRSTFQYQNMMYLVAGMMAECIAGQRWEDVTRARILAPLGMAHTATSLEDMVSGHANHAAPHMVQDDVPSRIPVRAIHTRPSGSICASISDMASYLQFHLDPTRNQGGLRLSADSATELTLPQIYMGRSNFADIGDVHYGLGFDIAHYRGERQIVHGGAWSGYTSEIRMLPARGLGVAVLTNGHWHSGCAVISLCIFDRLLGLDPLPWLERLRAPAAALRAQRPKEIVARATAIRPGARPSHDLPDYAGDYEHPAYGVVRIACADGALRWHGLGLDLPIAHRHYDVFELGADRSIWFENMIVQFHTDREGDIASLALPLEPAVGPIVFRRRAEAAMLTREFLEPLAGLYRRCGVPFRIAFDDADGLSMTRGNGPRQRLRPCHGGTFTLPDDDDFRLQFRRDDSGTVDAMLFHEATGIYLVERVPVPDQDAPD